jgi:hypothetical protein
VAGRPYAGLRGVYPTTACHATRLGWVAPLKGCGYGWVRGKPAICPPAGRIPNYSVPRYPSGLGGTPKGVRLRVGPWQAGHNAGLLLISSHR